MTDTSTQPSEEGCGPDCAAGSWCSGGWPMPPARGDSSRDLHTSARSSAGPCRCRGSPASHFSSVSPSHSSSRGTTATAASGRSRAASWRSSRCCSCSAAASSGTSSARVRRYGRLPTPIERARLRDRCSIAVLPFVNMSADKEQEYFADGISEELLNLLAQVPELRVIARTSSFSFKGKDVDIAEIARRLNVANVLEGSVRKSGDTLRITAQLVRASDSSHLWSQTYDRQMTDVFKVQDEIAAAVVDELKIKLLGAPPTSKVTNPTAYTLYLQARELRRQAIPESFEHSAALLQQALAIDPAYTVAWAGLGATYINQAVYGGPARRDRTQGP